MVSSYGLVNSLSLPASNQREVKSRLLYYSDRRKEISAKCVFSNVVCIAGSTSISNKSIQP